MASSRILVVDLDPRSCPSDNCGHLAEMIGNFLPSREISVRTVARAPPETTDSPPHLVLLRSRKNGRQLPSSASFVLAEMHRPSCCKPFSTIWMTFSAVRSGRSNCFYGFGAFYRRRGGSQRLPTLRGRRRRPAGMVWWGKVNRFCGS
jgi:hypothetical protein